MSELAMATPDRAWPWWKWLGAALLMVALVWAAVISTWQVKGANPGAGDLLLWLVLFPAGLILVFLGVRLGARQRQARIAAARSVSPAGPGADDAAVLGHTAGSFQLSLQAHAVWLRLGADADTVLATIHEAPRPGLHAQLRDSAGFPVFAAPVDGVDAGPIPGAGPVAGRGDDFESWDEEVRRAFALLEPVAEALLDAALPDRVPHEAEAGTQDALPAYVYAHSRSVQAAPHAARPVLHIHLLLPAPWPPAARDAAAVWIQALAAGFGHDPIELHLPPVTGAREVWSLIDRIGAGQLPVGPGDRHLLLATHSELGQGAVDRLEQAGELFSARHPDGRIPGEAAAGVLLDPSSTTATDPQPAQLHRPAIEQAQRDRTSTRAAIAALAGTCERALASAGVPATAVCAVVGDADHRADRAVEAAGALVTQFPDLEPGRDALHLGHGCGDLGHVAPLALLALAAAQAEQARAPVMVLGLADPISRTALVLSPSSPSADELSATSAPPTRM